MTSYANVSGKSNVRAYEVAGDYRSITVEFRDGSRYRYTADSVGEGNLERMRHLAWAGLGLNSFINRHVRKMYASKE